MGLAGEGEQGRLEPEPTRAVAGAVGVEAGAAVLGEGGVGRAGVDDVAGVEEGVRGRGLGDARLVGRDGGKDVVPLWLEGGTGQDGPERLEAGRDQRRLCRGEALSEGGVSCC
jgi:hypothetical protein